MAHGLEITRNPASSCSPLSPTASGTPASRGNRRRTMSPTSACTPPSKRHAGSGSRATPWPLTGAVRTSMPAQRADRPRDVARVLDLVQPVLDARLVREGRVAGGVEVGHEVLELVGAAVGLVHEHHRERAGALARHERPVQPDAAASVARGRRMTRSPVSVPAGAARRPAIRRALRLPLRMRSRARRPPPPRGSARRRRPPRGCPWVRRAPRRGRRRRAARGSARTAWPRSRRRRRPR